jgi:DNA-binding CsgD family transcriptional regulator
MRKKGSLEAAQRNTGVDSHPARSSADSSSRKDRLPVPRALSGRAPRDPSRRGGRLSRLSPLGIFILEKLDRGVLLLDADGAVVDSNGLAQKTLGGEHGMVVRNGRLAFCDPRVDERFTRMLAPGRGGPVRAMAVSLKCKAGLPCRVVIATTTPQVARGGVKFVALIYTNDGARSISTELLTELYGLTRAQANVARRLYAGCSVEETATQLKLSLNTVRTHLKQIFSKCDVQSQAELLHTLATGPQML